MEKISAKFQEIADFLNKMIPVDWTKVMLRGIRFNTSTTSKMWFIDKHTNQMNRSGRLYLDYNVEPGEETANLFTLNRLVRELDEVMIEEGNLGFTILTYILYETGKADISFSYEDYNELSFDEMHEIEEQWVKDYVKL